KQNASKQQQKDLYHRIFRLTRKCSNATCYQKQAVHFKESQNVVLKLMHSELIKQCIGECTERIETGLYYQIPYPRPIHLLLLAFTFLESHELQIQKKLRKFSKSYLKSHNKIS
uniref:Uncharacterized protein n=1 Tax=Sarcophilus harrisii TaxID=9305 RepID=A0A7N4P231_SARHA